MASTSKFVMAVVARKMAHENENAGHKIKYDKETRLWSCNNGDWEESTSWSESELNEFVTAEYNIDTHNYYYNEIGGMI